MGQKQKLIFIFAAVGLIFSGSVLQGVPVMAQSYPGLSTAPKDSKATSRNSRTQDDRPGYRGLVTGQTPERRTATPRAAARPERPMTRAPTKPKAHNPEKYYGQSHVQIPKEPKIKQSLPANRSPKKPVATEEDLRLASAFAKAHPENMTLGDIKISEKTRKALNQPRKIENGMYPKEISMMNYINTTMRKINDLPREEQEAKVAELRDRIGVLMDANYSRQSLPDRILGEMGMTPEAIAETRKEDKAVNVRLGQVLEQLK